MIRVKQLKASKIRSFDWLKPNGAFFNFCEQADLLFNHSDSKEKHKISMEIQFFVFGKSKSDFRMTFEPKSFKNRI